MGKSYVMNPQTMSKIRNRLPEGSAVRCFRCEKEVYVGDYVFSKARQSPLQSRKNYANNGRPMPAKVYHYDCAGEVHLV